MECLLISPRRISPWIIYQVVPLPWQCPHPPSTSSPRKPRPAEPRSHPNTPLPLQTSRPHQIRSNRTENKSRKWRYIVACWADSLPEGVLRPLQGSIDAAWPTEPVGGTFPVPVTWNFSSMRESLHISSGTMHLRCKINISTFVFNTLLGKFD